MEDPNILVVKPEIGGGLRDEDKVCTQPIIRAFTLEPTFDFDYRIKIDGSIVIVMPSQMLLNHAIIGKWLDFAKRQKKERKNLFVIDEADTVFYNSLIVEIPKIEINDFDIEILETFSSKRRKLRDLVPLYSLIYNELEKIYKNSGFFDEEQVDKIKTALKDAEKLVKTFNRRKKEIAKYVCTNKKKTNVFRLVQAIEELLHVTNLSVSLRSIEMSSRKLVIQDYDFGIRLFLDPTYPWRYFWKIILTATFPTEKLVESRFLSFRAKTLTLLAERKTKTYKNVYVTSYPIFPEDEELVNRNKEIELVFPEIIKLIKKAYNSYRHYFVLAPLGITLWLGNKTQYNVVYRKFRSVKIPIKKYRNYSIAKTKLGNIFISYVGSPVSRGIDLNMYDISIVISPLLRPPRPIGFNDAVDFAKAVAEAVQSAMRIVRSPVPERPKLVVIESRLIRSYYASFYPEWFKQLFINNYIELV